MPRPKKKAEDRRIKFDALYVTAAERAEINAAAAAAGLSVSRYLVALHSGHDPHRAQRRSDVLAAFFSADHHLQNLARLIAELASPLDAVRIVLQLIDIEREFRRTARLPVGWRTGDPDVQTDGSDAT
jgi:hypothetical protein